MGVDIKDLLVRKEIALEDLTGRRVAIDALNVLYQFVTIIRQPDGTPLRDSKGRVTSHLSGLFYRTIKLLENDVKPCYVFDGAPPEFKSATTAKRREKREEAREKAEEARERGDTKAAYKHSVQGTKITDDIINSSKELLEAMGVPYVQAPSEGEAQAAYMAERGDVWALSSQDYDSLLFGTPRLLRNVAVTGKRKLPGKNVYVDAEPEMIVLEETLEKHGIDREDLITMGILIGTDYNPGGIKGIGPKTAIKLIKEKKTLAHVLEDYEWVWDVEPHEVLEFFKNPPHQDEYELSWRAPDEEMLHERLVKEHDFSENRVGNAIRKLRESRGTQGRLDQWA